MSHPEKDEIVFIKSPKFLSGVMGSPAGEVKQIICTPFITMVDLDYYDKEEWDNVYVDPTFCLDEFLYAKKHYKNVINKMPKWIKE